MVRMLEARREIPTDVKIPGGRVNPVTGVQFLGLPGGMFANCSRARAHSHGHAHDCRHAHARGYYHGHKKIHNRVACGHSRGHAHFTLAVPVALYIGTPVPT